MEMMSLSLCPGQLAEVRKGMHMGKLEPNPGPRNVIKLVVLILTIAYKIKAQDSKIRQGEKSAQASL